MLLLAVLAGLAGCASNQYPAAPKDDNAPAWNYLIGPGDSVNVFVWRNPEVSGNFPVRPDGKMTMSLVEDMPASGKT
ncbi:MAG TPA: sugar ABC transporter substrate-binding protein, partial [Betaproteobacteria bacterium]|nr:sugar ABC transporter substrate-binding protein [Betaproteobacteria bacterium]